MKERPILFSAPMVRAILAGTKTQTRRVVKPEGAHHLFPFLDLPGNPTGEWAWCSSSHVVSKHIRCPYGQPGDRLWVRETFFDTAPFRDAPLFQSRATPIAYRADNEFIGCHKWRPSIYMPRWASRITLEINAVRVERLKDITWSDAAKEGIHVPRRARDRVDPEIGCVAQFRMLWEQINGSGSWDTNPWVWVVEFKGV